MSAYDDAINSALECLSAGKEGEAVTLARIAFDLKPNDAEAASLLGLCLAGQEVTREEAYQHLRRAVEDEPKEPRWQVHLGQGLTKAGRYEEAEKAFAAAAELSGGHLGLLMQWGKALRLAGRPADASQVYARVIQRSPSPAAWLAASEALTEARDTINAAFAYEKAFPEPRPDFAEAHLADLHIALGHYDKAKVFNDSLRGKNPNDADAGLRAANLMRWTGDIDGAKALLSELWTKHSTHAGLAAALLQDGNEAPRKLAETIARDESANQDERRRCAFALCDFADKSGDTDAAWEWAVLANSLYPKTRETLKSLREMLDKAIMAYHLMPDADVFEGARATNMIYVIGPPRSGGSLLQTILARHDGARSVGERGALLSFLPQLLDAPDEMAAQIEQLAAADIAGMTRAVGMADYFVDKTPHYFLLAGLLEKVHGGAQFVAPNRDIKDMAISLFFHEFGQEFPFTRNLPDIQEYLDFHESALVRWGEAGVKIISHNHDRFVDDAPSRGAALFKSLGLNWSSSVLEDQAEDGAVRTFSARQVRGGVSAKFKGRGERYARQLEAAGFRD